MLLIIHTYLEYFNSMAFVYRNQKDIKVIPSPGPGIYNILHRSLLENKITII